jgi:hypothetical protein
MDSVLGWLLLSVGSAWTLVMFAKAAIAEADRKARAGEADWIRLETEWRR